MLERSCAACHVAGVARPFYAKLPLVSSLVEHDVSAGLRDFDFASGFPAVDRPVPEPVLAKIEREIVDGEMPPLPYLAMHWNAALGSANKQLVLAWVQDSRARQATPGAARGDERAADPAAAGDPPPRPAESGARREALPRQEILR